MLIRKNTKAYKTIVEIVAACQQRPDRDKLIRLYITKAGHTIRDRIDIGGIQDEADVFYEMNFQAILINLTSSGHQLHQSDKIPGIYFFHSTNKTWDETPFEFDEAIKKYFGHLPDLPVLRKKEKPGKFILPTPEVKPKAKPIKKEKPSIKKVRDKEPTQPNYRLKHKIQFTNLDKVVDRQSRLTKKNVLDYYSEIADYLLPYLKDRPLSIRLQANDLQIVEYTTLEELTENHVEVPDWIQRTAISKSKERNHYLLCNDKDHLLWYAEIGALEFDSRHGRIKSPALPDYMLINIQSLEAALGKANEVARIVKDILSGLQLPSFFKTDGMSGLHVYIPLDSKSDDQASKKAAQYIGKLVCLKAPNLVASSESDYTYGKVSLDYLINEEEKSVIAPYSLVSGALPVVATPLLWQEVNEELCPDAFNHETIFKRLKQTGDPFQNLFKKRVSAKALLERMELNYSFLF